MSTHEAKTCMYGGCDLTAMARANVTRIDGVSRGGATADACEYHVDRLMRWAAKNAVPELIVDDVVPTTVYESAKNLLDHAEGRILEVEQVLDAYHGTGESDGTGKGTAADVDLLGRQRDEARQEIERVRAELAEMTEACDTANHAVGLHIRCAREWIDERNRLRAALAELVRLKDGPRGATYEAAKTHAWQAARDALNTPTESSSRPESAPDMSGSPSWEPGVYPPRCSTCRQTWCPAATSPKSKCQAVATHMPYGHDPSRCVLRDGHEGGCLDQR